MTVTLVRRATRIYTTTNRGPASIPR